MPKIAKRVVKKKRAYSRSYYRSSAPAARVSSYPGVGLGASAVTTLKTCFFANLVPNAGGVYAGYIQPGSCFAPGGTVAGSSIQPTLFDQWGTIFGRYLVLSARVKIEMAKGGTTAGQSFLCAAYPTLNSSTPTNYQGAAGQPFAKHTLCGPYDHTSSNAMTFNLKHKDVLGLGHEVDDDNAALIGFDPTTGKYMLLYMYFQNASNSTENILLQVTMTQTVRFDQRKTVIDV